MREGRTIRSAHLVADLNQEAANLWAEPGWQAEGHVAKTLIREGALSVVLIALRANAALPPHHAPGPITVAVLSGEVDFWAAPETVRLGAGQLLALETNAEHGVTARTDSAILVTIVLAPDGQAGATLPVG